MTASATLPRPIDTVTDKRWLFGLASFLLVYAPLYYDATQSLWKRDEHAHGALILVIVLWLIWQNRSALSGLAGPSRVDVLAGWASVALGLLTFLLGRGLSFSVMEFGSQIPVAAGIALLVGGRQAVRILWFPLIFMIFMIPLPGVFVDSATGALKQWVSVWAETALRWMNYPVGRTGVTLVVGQYQLLVADACSGLHSMFTLAAMGVLFMYLKARTAVLHNALMLSAILPIAFLANIVRVIVLVLVTYHLGDEAGQGFLHGAAGVVLMVAALLTFMLVDRILSWLTPK
jgi:exosortase B